MQSNIGVKSAPSKPEVHLKENLLSAKEIDGFIVTVEILQRYRNHFPDLTDRELADTIKSHFGDEDGWRPMYEGGAFLDLDFEGDPCEKCGNTEDNCTCKRCEKCGKHSWNCDCCTQEDVEQSKEFFDHVKAVHQKEREAEENGEFLASMVLDRAHHIFEFVAEEISRTANVPETFAIAGILFAISSAIGKGLFAQFRNGQKTSLGLMFLGFDLSGGGKSECVKASADPLIRKNRELAENWKEDIARVETELELAQLRIDALKKKAKGGKQLSADEQADMVSLKKDVQGFQESLKSAPALWTEDTTMEAARDLLVLNHGQITMLSDDAGKALINLSGVYNKLQMPEDHLFLKGYSGSDYRADRVGKGAMFIPEVWLNMFWTTQPDKLQLLSNNVWLSCGGFLARCLIAQYGVRPHVLSDDAISTALLDSYYKEWQKIYRAYRFGFVSDGSSRIIQAAPEAIDLLKEWEKHIVDGMNGPLYDFISFAARWRENTIRIAGVLHVMRHLDKAHENPLEVEEVERAIVIMQFYIRQQMSLLRQSREAVLENDKEELFQLLKREGGEITTGKLKKNGRNVEEMLSVARAWPKLFRIEEVQPGEKGGKPFTKIVLA